MIEKYVDNAYMLRFWGRIKDIFDKGGTSYSIPNLTEAGAMSIVEHLEALYELLNDEVTDAKKHTTLEGTTGKISVTPTTDKTTGKVNYTVTVDATYVAKITKLEADYAKKLKKADVKINGNVTDTTVTVNGFGKNGSIEAGSSNKLEVNIPANPAAAMVGGSSTDKGVKVETNATGQKVGQPKVSLEAGEVAEDETKLTTGGKVYDAIKEMLSDNSETINKTTSFGADTLIPGTITVKSSTGDGEAQVTLNPTLAVPEGKTASAMATDAYVATKTNGIGTEYSFDETSVPLEPGADNVYSGTLTMSGTNGSSNTVSISINASSFVTDAFLTGSSIVTKEVTLPDSTKEDHKFLRLTVTLADGTLNNIDVDINKFIDLYKEGNGIEISDDLKVSTNATGYVTTGDNGLDLTADTLANATSTTGLVDPTKIATKKYVDSVNSEAAISVKGDASVTKFGDDKTFEITVGEGDGTQTYKFNVKLPSLTTTDTTATKNVVTTIDETGAISIATNEAAGSATGTNHKLATVGYVKEKVAGVTYTDDNATVDIPTSGTNKNKVSLVADETNGYLKVDASGVNINPSMISDGDTSTTGHDLLATEKYVANKIAEGGISITSPTSTAKLTPVDGSTSKTYKIDMEVASWDDDEGTYTF